MQKLKLLQTHLIQQGAFLTCVGLVLGAAKFGQFVTMVIA